MRGLYGVVVRALLPTTLLAACGSAGLVLLPESVGGDAGTIQPAASSEIGAGGHDASEPNEVDSGSGDAGADASDSGLTLGAPIVVNPSDYEKWVWVSIPEMHCADGSTAGVAANFTGQSRNLVIFFQGGGACWNALTCGVQGDALKPVGPDFKWMPATDGRKGIFDRSVATNPYKDSNFVYIPYCTGDGHLGSRPNNSYNVRHVGYINATAATKRIVPTFSDATRVVVAGFSAGGIGASVNFHQIASAFESVGRPVLTLINDSGPFVRAPYLTAATENELRTSWNVDASLGAWCPTCGTDGVHDIYRRTAELHPGMRGALVNSYEDQVVRVLYLALGSQLELGRLKTSLLDLATWEDGIAASIAPSQWRQFFYAGSRHGAIEIPLADTPGLTKFLTDQLSTGTWTSVRP